MLKCQRNDESSFAVSASMCIRRKEGSSRGHRKGTRGSRAAGRREIGDKGSRARRRTRGTYIRVHIRCASVPALSAMLILAIFN